MRVIRVLFGFVVACVAAAATLVLFVYTPSELANLPADMRTDRIAEAGFFTLAVAPHVAMFAAVPALVGVIAGERRGISSWSYYVLAGIGIAVLGFLIQHFTETPGQTTILHNYALMAFLTAGFAGGCAYWLFSGRLVASLPGNPPRAVERPATAPHSRTGDEATPHKA